MTFPAELNTHRIIASVEYIAVARRVMSEMLSVFGEWASVGV